MIVYAYHPESGELVHSVEADSDPMNAGAFLIPAHTTETPPPELCTDGFVVAWNGSTWIEVEDHRGETWWTASGNEVTIRQIGNPVEHELSKEPPPSAPEPVVGRMRFAMVGPDDVVVQILEAECPMNWRTAPGYRMVVDEESVARLGHSYDGRTFKLMPEKAPLDEST